MTGRDRSRRGGPPLGALPPELDRDRNPIPASLLVPLVAGSLIAVAVALFTALIASLSWPGVIVSLYAVLYAPGVAIVFLLPLQRFDARERLILALPASFALIVLIGAALDVGGVDLHPRTVVTSVLVPTYALLLALWWRHGAIDLPTVAPRRRPRRAVVPVAIALAALPGLLVGLLAGQRAMESSTARFTSLQLRAPAVPKVTGDGTRYRVPLALAVENHEGVATSYRLAVVDGDGKASTSARTLASGATWRLDAVARAACGQTVSVRLLREGSGEIYRRLAVPVPPCAARGTATGSAATTVR